MPAFPPSSWSAPETNEPKQQRKYGAERCADRKLKRQNVDKITGSKEDARAESDENAKHAAKKPCRKKGSEYIEGGCADLGTTAQRQQRQRNDAGTERTPFDPALRRIAMLFRQVWQCLGP